MPNRKEISKRLIMQTLTTLKTMLYCPKCQQTYEDGTQRFCVNDGVRLHPQKNSQTSTQTAGVFSGIINKNGIVEEKTKQIPQPPKPVSVPVVKRQEIKSKPPEISKPVSPGVFSKLIKPNEIPSGQAALGDRRVNPVGRVALSAENPNILLGQTIKGRYFIKSRVSQTAHSIKYAGTDKLNSDKKVIVRIYTGKFDGSDFSAGVFADERVGLSHINHPNIAKVCDSGELPEGNPFIVSDHVKGISLKEIFAGENRFSILQIGRIIRQAANALSEAHQNGVLHRNLNPDNLILSVNEVGAEQIKVSDFNIFSTKTRGEFSYLAPEQIVWKPANFSADIYSLGVIAFQMLTGKMAFHGLTSKELYKNQQTGLQNVSFISKMYVPKETDIVLQKALSFNPADRFQSVRDFGDAFYNALTSESENQFEPETGNLTARKTNFLTEDYSVSLDSVLEETVETNKNEPISPLTFAKPDAVFVGENVEKQESGTITADEIELEIEKPLPPIKLQKTEPTRKFILPAKEDKSETPWERRSIEPIAEGSKNRTLFSILGIGLLIVLTALIFYYFVNRPAEPEFVKNAPENNTAENTQTLTITEVQRDINEIPPPARQITQPENTVFFENSKENLSKELLKYYRNFKLYYPTDWKKNKFDKNRAKVDDKFIDISKNDAGGIPIEQFMVTYYDSLGTYDLDKNNFPAIVQKASDDIKNSPLPNFQLVSEGQVMVNDWKAHEMKFQGEGTAMNGEKIKLWGRRFYIPAARSGIKKGLVVTLLATSLSKVNQSANDLGEKGDLKTILSTFEPDQNF
ncbi:MAG: serine/threonine protein kinase [Pyrinomonadaceae bacterium]